MGLGGEGYLASPAVVAASALVGYMAPPSELGLVWDPERSELRVNGKSLKAQPQTKSAFCLRAFVSCASSFPYPHRCGSSGLTPSTSLPISSCVSDEFAGWKRPARASRNRRSISLFLNIPKPPDTSSARSAIFHAVSTALYLAATILIGQSGVLHAVRPVLRDRLELRADRFEPHHHLGDAGLHVRVVGHRARHAERSLALHLLDRELEHPLREAVVDVAEARRAPRRRSTGTK